MHSSGVLLTKQKMEDESEQHDSIEYSTEALL
jgi:hypothetical protein